MGILPPPEKTCRKRGVRPRRDEVVVLLERDREQLLQELESVIGYQFSDRKLLIEAVTHRSYVNEARSSGMLDNQRLEFFGDAVLGLLISSRLLRILPVSSEGNLSRTRASLVDAETLAGLAEKIDLGRYLLLGRGEEKSGGRKKKSLLADAFESLVAAVYLDGGIGKAEQLVDRLFGSLLSPDAVSEADRDYKTRLQEISHALCGSSPEYIHESVTGPDHDLCFSVAVSVGGERFGRGVGKSKKEAEQAAAREALEALRKRDRNCVS
ncbi:MAG: ribonuclease III [Geobacteraceae bacterium]|nr:ribonuclease III [Geobacteraceae bacterium]